ncbi:hypothetical protein ACFB49_46880 [Sphingomonas sp. DBB INV C78]
MRAVNSGIRLSERDAAIIKTMIARGDRQHDIAAWFGVNSGRIGEIASGKTFDGVALAAGNLPPRGPYPSGREATIVLDALAQAKGALASAEAVVRRYS